MLKALVLRAWARGDILRTMPIITELHKQGYLVDVLSKDPSLFKKNPYVNRVDHIGHLDNPAINHVDGYDKVVNLIGLESPQPWSVNVIDAYSMKAFGHTNIDHSTYLWQEQMDLPFAKKDYVVVNCGYTETRRTIPLVAYENLTAQYKNIVCVGASQNGNIDMLLPRAVDFRNKTNYNQLAYLIENASLYIGPDGGVLHIAATTNTDILALFTATDPAIVGYPWRKNFKSISVDLSCRYCYHDYRVDGLEIKCKNNKQYECIGEEKWTSISLLKA